MSHPETGAEAAAALAAGRLPSNPEMLMFTNIYFHHVPNALAPSALATILVFTFCLGIVFLELAQNVRYDYILMKRSSWREPVKLFNRLAYLLSRYIAFVFLLGDLCYNLVPGNNCRAGAQILNVLFILPLMLVDIIFLQRTLVLYRGYHKLTWGVIAFYIVHLGFTAYSISRFGFGYNIPQSPYCGYQVDSYAEPHRTLFIVFFVVFLSFDTCLLILTTHRLTDGGLQAVPKHIRSFFRRGKDNEDSDPLGKNTLRNLLVRQGVIYYVVVSASRFAFISVYYTVGDVESYQVMIVGIIATLGPVMAGMLFRQTTKSGRRNAVRECTGSLPVTHSDASGGGVTPARLSKRLSTGLSTTGPSFATSSPIMNKISDMNEVSQSSEAYVFNATPSARRKMSLDLEAGEVTTKSDDEDVYGPGGFFDRKRSLRVSRPDSRDSAMTGKERQSPLTREFAIGTPIDPISPGDTKMDLSHIASVPVLCSDPSSGVTTPDSVRPPSSSNSRQTSRSRESHRPRRVPAPLPAPSYTQVLPRSPAEVDEDELALESKVTL